MVNCKGFVTRWRADKSQCKGIDTLALLPNSSGRFRQASAELQKVHFWNAGLTLCFMLSSIC